MELDEQKISTLFVGSVLVLLVTSPILGRILVFPRTEFFSELWILGRNQMAGEYPFNITSESVYSLYIGVGNQLGSAAYYKVAVKCRNQSQSAPDIFNLTSSNLPALYEIRTCVADEGVWVAPVEFSVTFTYNKTREQVHITGVSINRISVDAGDLRVSWDPERQGFYVSLFFELYAFHPPGNHFEYHERFVSLWLNMTI